MHGDDYGGICNGLYKTIYEMIYDVIKAKDDKYVSKLKDFVCIRECER